MHDLPLITTIAAGLTGAWLLGLLTQRLGLSPIVGYLLAGVLIGPHTPGFVGDVPLAHQLAEIGVILLMFGVGLHFQFKDLLAVKGVAVPGAVVQSAAATALALLLFTALGLPAKTSAVIGMAMAVASTVVLMRVLMDADALQSPQGHVAVGWLIVEDVFTVVLLVLLPVLGSPAGSGGAVDGGAPAAGGATVAAAIAVALLKLVVLAGVVLVGGARVIPWILVQVARLRSRELFTLTVLVFSIAIATGAYYVFGASMALGAFLAGMVVAQSPLSHQAAADALPLRDAFAVLFFVSVGMLFDPAFVVHEPLMLLAALGIILVGKPLAALAIVALLGHGVRTGLTVALGLAQIGEFSFILSQLAGQHGLMPPIGHNLLVAAAIISITLNPLLFRLLPRLEAWLRGHPYLWHLLNGRAERQALAVNAATAESLRRRDPAPRLAVVIGYGPVGRSVHNALREARLTTAVIDLNISSIAALRTAGVAAVFGNAAHESILEQAGVRQASHVVLTLPQSSDRAAIVAAVRHLNPAARVLVRARYLRERADLEQAGATAAVFEEAEAAVGLARLVLADTGVQRAAAERKARELRLQLIVENVADIRARRVRSVMVPWTRVRRLRTSSGRDEVLARIAQERYSRWPVEGAHGQVVGYLLAKDLIAQPNVADWRDLVRPLQSLSPDEDIETALERLQAQGVSVCLVADAGQPVGLITLDDVLEQVIGRIEDEYPHAPGVSVRAALLDGAVLLDLPAGTGEEAIRRLAAALPAERLPRGRDAAWVAQLALAREREVSTDLGIGVALPHARCPQLAAPLIAFGRAAGGVIFAPESPEPVRFVCLLVTPAEQPEVQLTLLGRLSRSLADTALRDRLAAATTALEVVDLLAGQDAPSAAT